MRHEDVGPAHLVRITGRPVRGTGDQQAHLVISSGGTRCVGMFEVLHMCIGRRPPVSARNRASDDVWKFQMRAAQSVT